MAGVQAGSAGRLSIEIVAEIARLQQDMDRVKKLVNATSGDIARSAKAANDNLAGVGRGAGVGVQKFARDVSAARGGVETATRGMADAFKYLAASIGLISIGAAARQFLALSDQSKQLTAQLRLATSESGSFAKAQEDVLRIAAATRSGIKEVSDLYGTFQRNARELGISQDVAARSTETITKAFRISGATAAEAAGGLRQFLQGIQSGTLRGEELNSVLENAPRLARALADGLGVTIGQLRAMGKQGELTGKAVIGALNGAASQIDREFSQLPITFDEAMTQLHNTAVTTFGAFDRGGEFSSMLTDFMVGGTEGFRDLERAAESFGRTVRAELDGLSAAFGPVIKDMTELVSLFNEGEKSGGLMFSKLFGELDAISAWYARNQWLDSLATGNLFGVPKSVSQTNLQRPYEAAAAARFQKHTDEVEGGFAGRWLDRSSEMGLSSTAASAINAAAAAKDKDAAASQRRAERLARESAALDVLINGLYKAAAAYGVSTAAGMRARIEAEAMEKGMKRQADVAAYAAQQQLKWVAQEVEGSAASTAEMLDRIKAQEFVNKAVREGTMLTDDASEALSNMAEQQKLMTVMAVARANSDVRGYAAAEKALAALTEAQLRDIAARKEAEDLSRADQINRQIEDIQLQTKLMKDLGAARINAMRGLSGNALDDELAKIAAQHEKIAIQAQAEAEKTRLLKLGYDDAAAAVMRKAAADKTQVDARLEIEQQIRQIEILTDRVNALSGAFSNIKGMGPLGDLFGVLTSRDPTAALLGMGGVGSLLGMFTKGGSEASLKIEDQMTRALESVFGQKAEGLAEGLASALTGGMVGGLAGSVVFGNSQNAQIGSQIGGALGKAAFKEFASKGLQKALGDFGGPLASIAGGLLGGLLGKALSSTKKGRATFAGDSFTTSGNSQQRIGAASDLAGSVLDALKQIGDAFDATVGTFDGTIGVRKNSIRYNASGTSLKQGANFGQDSAAAIAAAIQDAISDGVFSGLSDGVERLLKSGGDLETQLQKALSFQGVFDELKQMKDPQGAALDDLTKWHDNMASIFAEAGATSDQLAQLEELTGLKRQEIVEKYSDAIANAEDIANQKRQLEIQIMQLQGRTLDATNAARQMEKDASDASLHSLLDLRNALLDQADAAQKAARILALQARLYDAQGNSAAAERIRQQQELADAQSDEERALLKQIYAAERLAQAAQDAQAAAQKAADIEKTRAGLQIDLMKALGYESQALAKQRALELAAMDASLRGLQQQVWAAQDAAAAAEKFGQLGDALREFRSGLVADTQGVASAYRDAQVKFLTTGALARAGDENALGDLTGIAKTFLDASMGQSSYLQYQRDLADVLRTTNDAIDYTDAQVDVAQAQLDALKEGNAAIRDLRDEMAAFRAENQAENIAMKQDLGGIRRRLDGAEGPGGALRTIAETA